MLVVLLVFICFKIPQLHYPFYIDEGEYASAVKLMAIHGPSLLPGSISSDLSCGHPLMLHFLGSLWIRCFGSSNIAIHSFPLLVSVIFLVVLFECCRSLFGGETAILVLLLVATRVIFFVDSSFVYPEIMLAMFAFLSLYFYTKDRLFLTAIMLFMLFNTKEGGLLIGAVIGADAVVSWLRVKGDRRRSSLRMAAVLAPACFTVLFFAVQKARSGWYFNPLHTTMICEDWKAYYMMFKRGLYWSFSGDSAMGVLVFFIMLLSTIPAIKYKDIRYLFLYPPAFIVSFQAQIYSSGADGSAVWMPLFLLFFAVPVYFILQLNTTLRAFAHRFIILMGICTVIYLLYSSVTHIAYRYLIVIIVFLMIFLAISITTYVAASGKTLFYFTAGSILLIEAYGFYSNENLWDTQLGAFRVMNVQMHEFAYLEKENAYDKKIAYGSNWEALRCTDTLLGFLSPGRRFANMVRFPVDTSCEYAIFGNFSCNEEEEYRRILTNPHFSSVYKIRDGEVWAEVFKNRKRSQ